MDNNLNNILYIVVPCYNEEEVLPETSRRLREKMRNLISSGKISPDSRVMLVNDGSKDSTWEKIRALHKSDSLFSGVCLSRNRGHQNALMAGLMTAMEHADMVISMDADLQDDIDAVDEMVDKYLEGCEVVYGVRSSRGNDTAFKKGSAQGFYKLINHMGGELVYDHADYRLLSKRALQALSEYGEVNMFLRGIVPMLGYKTAVVEYVRGDRFAGESKYPLKKMLEFAVEGMTSLSSRPIRYVLLAGCVFLFAAFVMLVAGIVGLCRGSEAVSTELIAFLLLICSGAQLVGLGIVGEYVGKTYLETKKRPRYHISEILH